MSKQTKDTEITISKVEIKIGGETIRLTLEQAKDLQDILNKTFPKEQKVQYVPHYIDRTVYRDHYRSPHWDYKVTCAAANKADTGVMQLMARAMS